MLDAKRMTAAISSVFWVAAVGTATAQDVGPIMEVRGVFCDTEEAEIAFLRKRAEGNNVLMSANAVNKTTGQQVCAEFLPALAIAGEEKTVMSDGLVFTIQSYLFLPEKKQRWTGSFYGSMPRGSSEHGI